jgi:precorrin-2 dehydrogenase / sirohydrochlorin ferrochelatase
MATADRWEDKQYPIVLRLEGRRVLVVGGDKVAGRRAAGLLLAGAKVTAVSPKFSLAFMRLVSGGNVACVARPYRAEDLADMSLAVAATDNRHVNAQVRADARRAGVWVTVVDDPDHADFIVPAVVRRRNFLLVLASSGASPAMVGHLRRELDMLVPEDIGVLVDMLANARSEIQRDVADASRRRDLLTRLMTLQSLAILRAEKAAPDPSLEARTSPTVEDPVRSESSRASDRTVARPRRGKRRRWSARIRE